MSEEEGNIVPLQPPYGSATDGVYVCARCGESMTGCALCSGLGIELVTITDRSVD